MALIESGHPYLPNATDIQNGAINSTFVAMDVTFDPQTNVNGDLLYVQDEGGTNIEGSPFSGTTLAGKTVRVPGNVIIIQLVSGPGNKPWGYAVTSVSGVSQNFNFMTYHL